MIVCLLWRFVLCLFRIFTCFYFFIAVIAFMVFFLKRLYHGRHTRNSILVLDHCPIILHLATLFIFVESVLWVWWVTPHSKSTGGMWIVTAAPQSRLSLYCQTREPSRTLTLCFPCRNVSKKNQLEFLGWCANIGTVSMMQKRENS